LECAARMDAIGREIGLHCQNLVDWLPEELPDQAQENENLTKPFTIHDFTIFDEKGAERMIVF